MNVFDLAARITLDTSDYEQGLDDASKKSSSLASKIGSGLKTAAKVGAVAITAASTAVGALIKTSIDQYADYEQLVGGAKLLFGDAYSYISDKADAAYQNVQMSANDYLRQVNGFATGLKTALGGNEQAAAELADKIVTAEADIVAATGNTQENVQNAFNGIMKSNYTMLDNLQLGITPTKEGFQEVIDKVNEWNEANGRTTNYVIDNLADCQSALIDYIDMQGLSGYAMEEASQTIQGSLASVKGAWSNLVTGIADENANLDTLIGNFVDSVGTAADNIVPRISQILTGIGTMVQQLAPIIAEQVPILIETVVPSLLAAGGTLLTGLINGIIVALPSLIDPVIQLINQLSTFIIENLPLLVDAALQIILALADGIVGALPELIPAAVDAILQIVDGLIDNLDLLIDAAIEIILALADGLINALPRLLEKAPVILAKLVSAIIENAPKLLSAGLELIVKLALGIVQSIPHLVAAIPDVISALVDGFGDLMGNIIEIGGNLVNGIKEGISNAWESFKNWVKGKFDGLVSGVKNLLGIHSPSTVMKGVGENLVAGLENGMDDMPDQTQETLAATVKNLTNFGNEIVKKISTAAKSMLSGMMEYMNKMPSQMMAQFNTIKSNVSSLGSSLSNSFSSMGKNVISGMINGIGSMVSSLYSSIKNALSGLVSKAKSALGIHSPSKVFAGIGEYMVEGLGQGWSGAIGDVEKMIDRDMTFSGHISTSSTNKATGGAGLAGANINIYVNGANIQDDQKLAEKIAFELQMLIDREAMAVGA